MMEIERLVSVGGHALSKEPAKLDELVLAFGAEYAGHLVQLLGAKNGFYAFEGALHIFPVQASGLGYGLLQWNATELWKHEYGKRIDGCVFFAEDVFGNQFCLRDNSIHIFDPETSELEPFAAGLNKWAEKILADYNLWSGYKLAHEWQQLHCAIPIGSRLLPKIPFVMGGDYAVDNLYALDAAKGMCLRAHIAKQIHDLADGTAVRLVVQ